MADVDQDGRVDILLSPSEPPGEFYRISWFKAPVDPKSSNWAEHVIEDGVESVMHSLQAVDIDKDGDIDVITAKMHQGAAPLEVIVYLNVSTGGAGSAWRRQVIATLGSHSMQAADFDGDGDIDLFGANWAGTERVDLWRNDLNPPK